MDSGSSRFAAVEDNWVAVLGGVRDIVRQVLVAEQLAELLGRLRSGPTRVLDVGCGQGTQALQLARAGHAVVGLDPSADLLGRFGAALDAESDDVRRRVRLVQGDGRSAPGLTDGDFDLVLCHGVLMYLTPAEERELLASLAAVRGRHGRISLLVRNALGLAMRPGLLGRWDEMDEALEGRAYTNRLGLACRAHTPGELDRTFATHALARHAWWGVRVFSDHLSGPAPAGAALAGLLDAESRVSGRDPYRQVAALSHLVYGGDATGSAP